MLWDGDPVQLFGALSQRYLPGAGGAKTHGNRGGHARMPGLEPLFAKRSVACVAEFVPQT